MRSFLNRSAVVVLALSALLAACSPAATATTQSTQAVVPTQAETKKPTESSAVIPTAKTASVDAELPLVNPADITGGIYSAGSSTVYPLSVAVAAAFTQDGYSGEIKIDSVGTGGGFERFCTTGETDIANASRKIKDAEIANCAAINRTPIEFRVGTDAIAVVTNKENSFLSNVTLAELAMIFSDKAVLWSEVNPEWPAEEILRFTPGTDSGTYDYFVETVMTPAYEKDANAAKAAFLNAANLNQSEDDNVLVQGVEGNKYAIGFFGFAYYTEQKDRLNVVSLEGVTPDETTAESGEYKLSRPLFLYSDAAIMKEKPQVAAFINYYLTNVNDLITEVGYFPASDEAMRASRLAWLDAVK